MTDLADPSARQTVARRALVCLDLTNLDDGCDEAAIDAICRRAQSRHGSVAAVCIWPRFVPQATKALDRTGIKVATVVNFPGGDATPEAAAAEASAAVGQGADEIDMVVPWRALAAGDPDAVSLAVKTVKAACGSATLKAILETGELADAARIGQAAERALTGGADFLKTSTGKARAGATPEAAGILLDAIARHGGDAGFKAAGGVRSLDDAAAYLDLADRIMGARWAGPRHFRLGASGLLDALEGELGGGATAADDAPGGY